MSRPDLQGMWSDPPSSAEAVFCFVGCTDEGIAHLNALLDDPANDERPFDELNIEAFNYQNERYMRPRLTDAALNTFPLDPADDQLTVTGNPTHTGSPRIFFTRMVLPSGKEMIGPGAGDVSAIEEQRRQRARERSQKK